MGFSSRRRFWIVLTGLDDRLDAEDSVERVEEDRGAKAGR